MYQGTMIDELIAAVERAEEHARLAAAAERQTDQMAAIRVRYPAFVYEAPFGASMIGAA
jgi:hypothetical protein